MLPNHTILECWLPVVGWEGIYAISNLGRVRRERASPGATVGLIMALSTNQYGYRTVMLKCSEHTPRGRRRFVHQLVAEAFVGARPPGCGVNHINGNRTDNRATNLEWATPADNSAHAVALGLMPTGNRNGRRLHPERYPRGERQPMAKLTTADVASILTSTDTNTVLGARYGVSRTTIRNVRTGKIWQHHSS